MILAALIDAGVPVDDLLESLNGLNAGGFTLSHKPGQRGGVSGTIVSVDLDEEGKRPHHWREFLDTVSKSNLPALVVEQVKAVFGRLVQAEAMVHRTTPEETHLHELGEVDTLVDVVGSVMGLHLLGVGKVYASPFPSGTGVIRSAHGMLPVPAPATAALFTIAGAPVVPPPVDSPNTGEMVTPTGAAVLTTLATFRQPAMNVERVGYGLGSRENSDYPNVLALWLGEETGTGHSSETSLIETNIDDMSAEMLGFVMECLFERGARDVWFTPIQMKKNRPATMLSAIVPSALESQAVDLVMRETTTLGVRVRPLTRYEAERKSAEVDTSLGRVEVKLKLLDGKTVGVSPEFESCRTIALEKHIPLRDVYSVVQQEAEQALLDS